MTIEGVGANCGISGSQSGGGQSGNAFSGLRYGAIVLNLQLQFEIEATISVLGPNCDCKILGLSDLPA